MGHMSGKDIYRKLGRKIDNLTARAPWNETLHAILVELYSSEEADLVVKMPYGLSNFERLGKITKYNKTELRKLLDGLCAKGLVMDFWIHDEYHYMPSPIMIGIFEFTMMRTGNNLDTKKLAKLFHNYLLGDDSFFAANFQHGEINSVMRALPHEEAIKESDYLEVLDYEKAASIIEAADKFSIGICSCRHEKVHSGEKQCDVLLETCSSFGIAADFLIRHNLAREVSKSEMLENLARSKETGLVLNADNVRKNINFICHCCKCCCNALLGISKFGYAHVVVTSGFIAEIDQDRCEGCGKCVKACPIDAIEMLSAEDPTKMQKYPQIDLSICLGCGVCALKCNKGALKLIKRGKRVIHPETTFERIILQCLERGTLQNQIFDDPRRLNHQIMRGFLGGFLKLSPVKKALMSDTLRSTFLNTMKTGLKMQGKGWLNEI